MISSSLFFICLMVFMAGFVDSAAGGGGLISLPAYILSGVPMHQALGTNKFTSSLGTTFAVYRFWANGVLDLKISLISAAGAFVGSAIGTKLVLLCDEKMLKTALVVILPLIAIFIILKKDYGNENAFDTLAWSKAVGLAVLTGLGIGCYDGMFGPGTGTFAIIAFCALLKFDLRTASGNAKILNLASNYASLLTFALHGSVMYSIGIPAAVCGIAGNYLGSGLAIKKGSKFIRPMMVVVVVLLLVKMAMDLFK